jgi:hypothetical protein
VRTRQVGISTITKIDGVDTVVVHSFGPGGRTTGLWPEALSLPLRFNPALKDFELPTSHGVSAPAGYVRLSNALPGLSSSHGGRLSQADALARFLAPAVAPAGAPVPIPATAVWRTARYSLDGYTSVDFVVEALNSCYYGVEVMLHPLLSPPPAPPATVARYDYIPDIRVCVDFTPNHAGSVAEMVRAALATTFPHLAPELWKLQLV